jgi:2-hydroxycyclohexanecarboxyl-CoA dehydrogenase
MNKDLKGKVALVTGATEGLGLCIAEKLAQRGAQLVINGRSPQKAADALNQLSPLHDKGKPPIFVVGDCSEYLSAQDVVAQAAELTGQIDILVSVGATSKAPPKPFADMTPDELDEGFRSRFYARINPVHAAVPVMRESGGAIVLIGTDAARHPTPGESIIGAYGAAVMLMTKILGKEFARWNIRVNCVAMTITTGTASWDRVFADNSFQSKLFSKAVNRFPAGRPPNSSEVASAVTFFATSDSAQVTGQTLSVNGGLSFGGW